MAMIFRAAWIGLVLVGEALARTLFTSEGESRFDSTHLDDGLPVLFNPHSARPPWLCRLERDRSPIQMQDGLHKCRRLFGLAGNVMADQGAAKAVRCGVGKAAMHQRSPEKQDITRLHENGTGALAFGQGNGHVGE